MVKSAMTHTVLSLAISRSWPVRYLDVKNAFLHTPSRRPSTTASLLDLLTLHNSNRICLLNKSLYELKQAPWTWYN
jgi:hypothetical protein